MSSLSDKLQNICFIQELDLDRTQRVVRSRNNETFDEVIERYLEEEVGIFSKQEDIR